MALVELSDLIFAFLTLTALEIILGIDNVIFLAILVNRLPKAQQTKGRILGLSLAVLTRIALLFSLTWMMRLTTPLFSLFSWSFSGRDLILLGGGLFLIAKSVSEIHESLEGSGDRAVQSPKPKAFLAVLIQIALIDIIFSLDSVITAVGLVQNLPVMIAAIVIAVLVMMVAAAPIAAFIDHHPTVKMLALSFLVVIGVVLISEAFGVHVPKGYLYFAMAFSFVVEMLNIRLRKRMNGNAVALHTPHMPTNAPQNERKE